MIAARDTVDRALAAGDAGALAAALEQLVREEDALVLTNELKPYEDHVPAVVRDAGADQLAGALDRLPTAMVKRLLFGSYARVRDERVRELLAHLAPSGAARLCEGMAVGVDAPREIARVLSGADARHAALLQLVHPVALLRLLEQMPLEGARRVCTLVGDATVTALDDVLRQREDPLRREWLAALAQPDPRPDRPVDLSLLRSGPLDLAAPVLAQVPYAQLRDVLDQVPAERVALLLLVLAQDDTEGAASLLTAADRRLLLRPPAVERPVSEWLSESRAAAVVAALDPTSEQALALVRRLAADHLELLLPHLPWDRRRLVERELGTASLPLPIDVLAVGAGRRRRRRTDVGRWVQIEEELDTGSSRDLVVTDLLELPLDEVRLEACRAVPDDKALPVAEVAAVFEEYRRAGRRPSTEDFRRFGLVQLSREVERTGALAGINGNFYFDYGHYLNGVTLGIEMDCVPGLFFGDPIAWFVSNGEELAPPSFNRAAAAVTASGELVLDRVMMDEVLLDVRALRWEDVNQPKRTGRIGLYTSLYGTRTPPGGTHVDVACARGRVWVLSPGGAQVLPLTGFVLSVPVELAGTLLAGVGPGSTATTRSAFTREHPDVVQAMACGPLLVRNGVVDIDFEREDFGQQDSTVMSFFLPRTVETYRAARSFLGLRGRTLVLGSVSGSAYGFGRTTGSAGVTFGELAQLCVDVGLDTAYALDGGGSSSVVARDRGVPRVLNAPTGGADVAAGEERFINTYWLVHPRQEHP